MKNIEEMIAKICADSERVTAESMRPCVIFKAELEYNDYKWHTLYNGYLIGQGNTPAEAMLSFDLHWNCR